MRVVVIAAVLLFAAASVAAAQDLYDVLDLPQKEDATEREIKKQFRVLSRKFHPDHNPTDEARERYKLIQRAHEVLSDRRKRKIYDMKGDEGLKQLEESERNPNHGHDPFAGMFGHQQQASNKGQSVQMNLNVDLAHVYNGHHHTVTLNKQKICKACKGTGAASKSDFKTCTHCKGKGTVVQRVQLMPGFVQQVQQPCPHCGGKGKEIKKKCKTCKGKRVVRGDYSLEVEIERGIPEGHKLVYDMEADQSPDVLPGDVIFVVNSQPDKVFSRRGNDLEAKVKITLKQALLGFTVRLRHMDGHEVEVEMTGVTQFGYRKKIAGEGMPIHNVPSEKGDLYVTFEFELPPKLSEQTKEAIGSIFGKP